MTFSGRPGAQRIEFIATCLNVEKGRYAVDCVVTKATHVENGQESPLIVQVSTTRYIYTGMWSLQNITKDGTPLSEADLVRLALWQPATAFSGSDKPNQEVQAKSSPYFSNFFSPVRTSDRLAVTKFNLHAVVSEGGQTLLNYQTYSEGCVSDPGVHYEKMNASGDYWIDQRTGFIVKSHVQGVQMDGSTFTVDEVWTKQL